MSRGWGSSSHLGQGPCVGDGGWAGMPTSPPLCAHVRQVLCAPTPTIPFPPMPSRSVTSVKQRLAGQGLMQVGTKGKDPEAIELLPQGMR